MKSIAKDSELTNLFAEEEIDAIFALPVFCSVGNKYFLKIIYSSSFTKSLINIVID